METAGVKVGTATASKHPFFFTATAQTKEALAAYGNPRMKISRMLAAGELLSLRRGLYDAMRIEELPALDPEQLAACAACYQRPSVRHFARFFSKSPSSS